jgi:hypothetical protein
MAADQPACLATFDSNTPDFFAVHERAEFAAFLGWVTDPYFVVIDPAGRPIACGGYFTPSPAVAVLIWGMVHRDHHRQGIGRFLLIERLQRICQKPEVTAVKIDTSQHSAPFFAQFGFVADKITPDGFGPGLDTVVMILELNPARRDQLTRWHTADSQPS